MTQLRAFSYLSNRWLEKKRELLATELSQWHSDWAIQTAVDLIALQRFDFLSLIDRRNHSESLSTESGLWILPRQYLRLIGTCLLNESSPLIERVASDCFESLNNRLLSQKVKNLSKPFDALQEITHWTSSETTTYLETAVSYASGSWVVTLRLLNQSFYFVSNPSPARRPIRGNNIEIAPTFNLRNTKAISEGSSTLVCRLGEASIDANLVESIKVGDIIKLDRRIDEPCEVIDSEDRSVMRSWLGQRDGNYVITTTQI